MHQASLSAHDDKVEYGTIGGFDARTVRILRGITGDEMVHHLQQKRHSLYGVIVIRSILLVALGVCVGIVVGSVIWEHHASTTTSVPLPTTHRDIVPFTSITPRPPIVDWHAFNNAREKALQDNPELAAEYKALLQEASNNENEVNAAMIKADPKLAPILAKIEALRHHPGAQ